MASAQQYGIWNPSEQAKQFYGQTLGLGDNWLDKYKQRYDEAGDFDAINKAMKDEVGTALGKKLGIDYATANPAMKRALHGGQAYAWGLGTDQSNPLGMLAAMSATGDWSSPYSAKNVAYGDRQGANAQADIDAFVKKLSSGGGAKKDTLSNTPGYIPPWLQQGGTQRGTGASGGDKDTLSNTPGYMPPQGARPTTQSNLGAGFTPPPGYSSPQGNFMGLPSPSQAPPNPLAQMMQQMRYSPQSGMMGMGGMAPNFGMRPGFNPAMNAAYFKPTVNGQGGQAVPFMQPGAAGIFGALGGGNRMIAPAGTSFGLGGMAAPPQAMWPGAVGGDSSMGTLQAPMGPASSIGGAQPALNPRTPWSSIGGAQQQPQMNPMSLQMMMNMMGMSRPATGLAGPARNFAGPAGNFAGIPLGGYGDASGPAQPDAPNPMLDAIMARMGQAGGGWNSMY